MAEERLQKVMAAAGIGSRRACEAMIVAGRVQINGHVTTELGVKADPSVVQISVDGKPLQFHQRHVYIKVNKPREMLSDIGGNARGRRTVEELIDVPGRRVYPVGRLDLNSEGLVLLTDDGALAHRLSHPSFEHAKTYYVLVKERPTAEALVQLREGVELPTGKTAPAQVQVVDSLPSELQLAPGPRSGVWLEILLHEGKKRQIRHMTAEVGYPTLRLIRWAIGPLTLGKLGAGESAHLTRSEVGSLQRAMQTGGKGQTSLSERKPKRRTAPRRASTGQASAGRTPRPSSSGRRPSARPPRRSDKPRDSR